MKCPVCNHNQRRKKEGMRCTQCSYAFVFDPLTTQSAIRDNYMATLISKVSANNTRYFTRDMLYGAMLRSRKIKKVLPAFFLFLSLTLIFMGEFIPSFILFTISISIIGYRKKYLYFPRKQFFAYIDSWQKHSSLRSKLFLSTPSMQTPPPNWKESDIFDYGVEKIIILDNELSVDLLIKNNEHANAKALIMSSSGYPEYLQSPLKKILAEQEEVPIILLHGSNHLASSEIRRFNEKTGIDLNDYSLQTPGYTKEQLDNLTALKKNYPKQYRNNLALDMLPYTATLGLLTLSADELLDMMNNSANSLAFVMEEDDFG